MCGISGYLAPARERADLAIVRRMADTLAHRGPDDEGYYVDGPVALGHRRLRIIDLVTGAQPIANEDGTVQVVLNGEIYNFARLRADLEDRGHTFRTRSDTEVIAHAYEEFGDDCLAHFDGMFALALWDKARETLLLARDRFGEKPLYYAECDGWLVFGSELRAVLAHPRVERALDLRGLRRYLSHGYVPDPHSILAGIHKLPPGHFLSVTSGKSRLVRYWDLEFRPEARAEEDWAGAVWEALCRSVRHRLVADVPVGIFLSGGLDSSAIAAAVASVAPTQRVTAFSMAFEDASYSELPHARAVAERFALPHEALTFTADVAREEIPRLGALLDEPLADPSFVPTALLARHARRSVAVVLGGDGGDELWCGYPTFLAVTPAAWANRLPRPLIDAAARAIEALPSSPSYGSVDFLLKQFVRGLGAPVDERAQILMGGATRGELAQLLAPSVRDACGPIDPGEDLFELLGSAAPSHPVDRLVYHHAKLYLAGRTLVKMDRATMASGLEARAPFLDHTFAALACAVPAGLKVKRWATKYLLKRTLEGRLPDAILHRRKQGFGVPIGPWLCGPLRPLLEDVLSEERLERTGLFSPAAVGRLVREHLAGIQNHQRPLWMLLAFELWREAHLPGDVWT